MKSIIKVALIPTFFLAVLGTVGAFEVGNIGMLQAFIQGGACVLGLYFTMKWGTAR